LCMGKSSAISQPTRPTHPFGIRGLQMSSELESDVCYRVYGWRHLVKATGVTAGLAECNGSLLPGGWFKVTSGLTACTPGSALDPTLGNEYDRTLPYLLHAQLQCFFSSQLRVFRFTFSATAIGEQVTAQRNDMHRRSQFDGDMLMVQPSSECF